MESFFHAGLNFSGDSYFNHEVAPIPQNKHDKFLNKKQIKTYTKTKLNSIKIVALDKNLIGKPASNASEVKLYIEKECSSKVGDFFTNAEYSVYLMYTMKHCITTKEFNQPQNSYFLEYINNEHLNNNSIIEQVNYLLMAIELNLDIYTSQLELLVFRTK